MSEEVHVQTLDTVDGDFRNDGRSDNTGQAAGMPEEAAGGPTIIVQAGTHEIGKVASPPQRESTPDQFYFWIDREELVERTQIVRTQSRVGGQEIDFYGIVDEVYRQSRRRSIGEEADVSDQDVSYDPPFAGEGVTFAQASILRAEPPVLTPPREQSRVYLGGEFEARLAYGADEIENPLPVGLVKNGGSVVAGPGVIDLDYLLGVNGGHMNVNGVAGRGTKSSFLLFTIAMLLREVRQRAAEAPSDPNPLLVVPIVLNVKGYDLFYIDRWSRRYDPDRDLADWRALGVQTPVPFQGVEFYAPQQPGNTTPVPIQGRGDVQAYSWSLSDVIESGLLLYLFSDEDSRDANFSALVLDIEERLTVETPQPDGTLRRRLREEGLPATFQELLDWVAGPGQSLLGGHHAGTWGKLRRRLVKLVIEGDGVLRRNDRTGNPLAVARRETCDPIVVDLNALTRVPSLQRFVVATILRQLVDARTGPNAVRGLVYVVALDELNRFAPRGSRDPITQLIEQVAAEMRSQGIILLGAQQQASKVSERVIENASIRVLGRSGSLELSQPVWSYLSKSGRRKAETLSVDEKLVLQDNFREPMHVRVPFPSWAMNPRETAPTPADSATPALPPGPIGESAQAEDDIETF
ncbi:MAG: ATP-binding protein [Armatimonadota bacterium]